ncbi:uncharacterized protein LOC124395039 isoform X2 [Silurus meridionalis]|uniref:uncharacterized protein LOC124395039 isoform X2 n=1 Tax=Silurus meridionalis TaxID=175797 RepID=UPI001EEC060B|nr:uncharacterized protein LOC124395039 isoform X2 [Silurus meridionalis]
MRVKHFVQLLTFFSALVPNGLNCPVSCRSISLTARLGSEVLLPCSLSKSNKTEEARWSQSSTLLNIRPHGNITFEDPKDGRMTVFPLLFSRGNFSILVHQFQTSDMGIYCCQLTHECQRVVIENAEEHEGGLNFPWYYIAAGIVSFILLVFVLRLVCIFKGRCLKKSSDSYYVNSEEQGEAENKGPIEIAKVDECDGEYEDIESELHEADYENSPGAEHDGQYEDTISDQQDEDYVNSDRRNYYNQHNDTDNENSAVHHVEIAMQGQQARTSIYDNDEHTPNPRSKPTKKAEAATVLRKMPNQQPNSGQYYANQSEINKSGRPRKRTKDKEYQFKNPLYDQTPATNI